MPPTPYETAGSLSAPSEAVSVAPHGPFHLEMKVGLTNDDGLKATVSYDFPPGRMPVASDFKAAFEEILAAPLVVENGLRLMDRHEFLGADLRERFGMDIAVPGPNTWEAPSPLTEATQPEARQ